MKRFPLMIACSILIAGVALAFALREGGPYTATAAPSSAVAVDLQAYTTGYGWPDNTPPGGAIASPCIHQTAGGTGTYADPITIAVGHSITGSVDTLDYPACTIFYIPNVRRYFIVEDSCGDGNDPQAEACNVGYPSGTTTWVDMWVGGQGGNSSAVLNCESFLTDTNGVAHLIIENPANDYVVVPGPLFGLNGQCTAEYGNVPVASTPTSTTTSTPTSTTTSTTTTPTTSTSTSTSTSTTTTVPPAKPVNTKPAVLSGTAMQGDQLKVTDASWTGSPTSFSFEWERCQSSCTVARHATKQTYNLSSMDVGFRLEAVVTARNSAGTASADSNQSGTVVKAGRGGRGGTSMTDWSPAFLRERMAL
jgi:hypothetical protein